MSAGRAAAQEAAGGERCQPSAALGGARKVGSAEEERGSGERQRPGSAQPVRLGSALSGAAHPERPGPSAACAPCSRLLCFLFIYLFIY